MADRLLFISWGEPTKGREERAREVFYESVGLYGRLQQDGRIESFDVVFLEPHAGALGGYFEIHGSAEQLSALRESEEFRRAMIDIGLIVDDMRLVDGMTGDGVAREMELWTAAIAKVPQRA